VTSSVNAPGDANLSKATVTLSSEQTDLRETKFKCANDSER